MRDRLPIRVLVVENARMNCDLLVGVFGRCGQFAVAGAASEIEALNSAALNVPDVALISYVLGFDAKGGLRTTRKLLATFPSIKVVMMLDSSRREEIVEAFRAGAAGIFCRNDASKLLPKCVSCVQAGEVWAKHSQIKYALEALAGAPQLKIADNEGNAILTERQMQIVRCVADGLTNREIADALKLSEHTVKNYMFRIFDKLGVSTRVEVVLYAYSHLIRNPAQSTRESEMVQLGIQK